MTKKKIKFSKSYSDVLKIKKNFFTENNKNLNKILKINKFYIKQKKRKNCKICNKELNKAIFYSHKVK